MRRVAMVWFLSLVASACAGATSRTARPLEVRSSDDGVLACVPQDEGESVEIDAAGVTAITVEGFTPPKPWTMVLDPGQPPRRLAPGDCLAYGRLPDGYSSAIGPGNLKEEWPYSFAIRSPEWGKHGTRNHVVDFCLRRSGRRWHVVAVPEGPAAVTAETCRRLLEAADVGDF